VAADQPFMIGFPKLVELEMNNGWIRRILNEISESDRPRAWRAMGLIDALAHRHRLTMPVYLGAGTADIAIAPEAVEPLFQSLPGTRCYAVLKDQPHGYTNYFKQMATAWFRCYA
jgi:cephalosporin-C deacetylase-like acetyl esterase